MASEQWIESRIVGILLTRLAQAGWKPTATDTGDDSTGGWVKVSSAGEARQEINAVDMVSVEFTNADGRRHYVSLVHGNGVDLICDYTFAQDGSNNFDTTMQAITDHIEKVYA